LSVEFKEEEVKMVMEEGLSIGEVGRRLSIPKSTLDYWVKKTKEEKLSDSPHKQHTLVTQEQMELARLKRENAELKINRDILRKLTATFARKSLKKYAFINKMGLIYPIPVMCRVLSVSKSGYYIWCKRPLSERQIEKDVLK